MRDGRLVRHCASTVEARDDLSHTKTRRVTLSPMIATFARTFRNGKSSRRGTPSRVILENAVKSILYRSPNGDVERRRLIGVYCKFHALSEDLKYIRTKVEMEKHFIYRIFKKSLKSLNCIRNLEETSGNDDVYFSSKGDNSNHCEEITRML